MGDSVSLRLRTVPRRLRTRAKSGPKTNLPTKALQLLPFPRKKATPMRGRSLWMSNSLSALGMLWPFISRSAESCVRAGSPTKKRNNSGRNVTCGLTLSRIRLRKCLRSGFAHDLRVANGLTDGSATYSTEMRVQTMTAIQHSSSFELFAPFVENTR